jgi:hypothetical protein
MTVALDYSPPPGDAGASLARLADIRFRASRAFQITKLTPGAALAASGKQLYSDPTTGQPWRIRADGAAQLLVQSTATVTNLSAGRVATLELSYAGSDPLTLWLPRRSEVFAPPGADNELQASPYDTPVTVSR